MTLEAPHTRSPLTPGHCVQATRGAGVFRLATAMHDLPASIADAADLQLVAGALQDFKLLAIGQVVENLVSVETVPPVARTLELVK
jgi:hypothetical protein